MARRKGERVHGASAGVMVGAVVQLECPRWSFVPDPHQAVVRGAAEHGVGAVWLEAVDGRVIRVLPLPNTARHKDSHTLIFGFLIFRLFTI